ncbi:MAG: TRAP transporter large permease [Betaproteobacteria bacterium]|jgi:tripartite ATP-independent transporter DctM subunit|nr:TRAP transporter large permease [Betaproteobacteria bacterium]
MEWYWALAILLGAILLLMALGTPVGIAFLGVNVVAAVFYFGGSGPLSVRIVNGIGTLAGNAFESMANFAIVPIPMFLLMGELFFHTGLATRMFNAVDKLLGKVPARLSYVTVAGGTAFATLSGSSMGSTALLGTLMVPEMSRRKYKKSMSIGPILGTGGLAMLIPPSALAVLLGTLAKIDIGRLLVAGIAPGLILAALYAVLIYVRARLDPDAAPVYEIESIPALAKLRLFAVDVLPMISIVGMVIVLIMGGIATPSESAAFGGVGVVILAFVYRCFSWSAMWKSLEGATRVTVIALLILFGSQTFSQILAFSGGSAGLINWVTGFDVAPVTMLLLMFGILLILGMFMDQLAMMLLTVPIYFPIIATLDFGLPLEMKMIWFGVIMLLALEISFTTPPFGLLLFVMQGVAPPGTRFSEICLAAVPFMACAMLLVALIIAFPAIATWLPFLS